MANEKCEEYCYTWKIENYSLCYRKHKESLKSPIFTPNNCGRSQWYLEFYPLGRKNEKFASCVLSRSVDAEEISIAFKIELLNQKGNVFLTRGNDSSKYGFKRGTSLGWDDINSEKWKENNLRIKCQIISFFPAASEAVTEIGVDRCSFNWTVNFNDCSVSHVSRIFSFSEDLEYEIAVTLPDEWIKIKICELEASKAPAIICGEIWLLSNQGKKCLPQTSKHIFDSSDEGSRTWNYPTFLNKTDLKEEDNECVKSDSFSLLCEFSKANGVEQIRAVSSTSSHLMTPVNNILTLHTDLKSIFSDMKHSDVKLRTENVTFPAHKIFLSARSPVFSSMFDQDMIENKLNVVDILDVNAKTLKSFLEFIYTGSVKFQDSASALKLLLVAEKYQVLSLKETCSDYLMPVISVENACEILSAADMVNLKQLKKCTMDYIARHITDIWISSEWSELIKNSCELSKEIFSYFAADFVLTPKKN